MDKLFPIVRRVRRPLWPAEEAVPRAEPEPEKNAREVTKEAKDEQAKPNTAHTREK
jgi:hypothetical protein